RGKSVPQIDSIPKCCLGQVQVSSLLGTNQDERPSSLAFPAELSKLGFVLQFSITSTRPSSVSVKGWSAAGIRVLPALSIGLLLLLLTAQTALSGQWPAWRGPEGTGVAEESQLPLRWSSSENVRWRTALPGPGHSTPIVWNGRIFVTQAIENRRALMCFDRATGKLLWLQGPVYSESESTHETNPQGSSSPVTDGERVVVWFGSAGLYCYDLDGKELWHRDLGRQKHIWGWGSSPVLSGELCYLNFGPGEP